MKLPEDARIPCFLCGTWIPVKLSKNDKPYFICLTCGVQVFVRYKLGISSLKQLLKRFTKENTEFIEVHNSGIEVLSLTSQLIKLEKRLEEIENNKSLLDNVFANDDSGTAEKALKLEIKRINKQLGNVYLTQG